MSIIGRLFYLQILQHDKYTQIAARQHQAIENILPERGEIFALTNNKQDSGYYPLAINQITYEVYANPTEIIRPQNITDILVEVLELDSVFDSEVAQTRGELILDKLKKGNDKYEGIKKNVTESQVKNLEEKLAVLIDDININKLEKDKVYTAGIHWNKEILRYYPDKEIGAHILGFLGYDQDGVNRVGKYGVEGFWQEELAGTGSQMIADRAGGGRLLPFSSLQAYAKDGADLVLTIDRTVQYQACKSLEKAVALYDAEGGSVLIMETDTGAIRAMCTFPSFDPNQYNQVETVDVYNNQAVYHAYEPGSVMKAVAMAIAIDTGKVTADTIYEDKGEIKFAGGFTVRNSDRKAHGMVDMTEVLAASLNTGVIFATQDIKNKIYENYMEKFGFGQITGLSISQESKGDIFSLSKRGDTYKATASYGQGITATPLQMLNSFNALANRGNLVQPYLVEQVKFSNGKIDGVEPKIIRKVVSESTAATLAAMLVQVVDSGHAGKAAVPGYYVAGKTGTAQVADPETKGYSIDKTIHNFIGFAPVENPKFTMITKLDFPTAARFSADTAAPLFGEIAKFLLEYYQIPPNR
ncbi:penicillin-binding protein 2 [bacterium]|nr:penicillin-binding protein 2 [bacterium]MBT4649001.1 penicillin-binding protein 2 [bacterium]